MPPTPFHPTHTTPFKSSLSSSQQTRTRTSSIEEPRAESRDWPQTLEVRQLDSRHWTYLAEGGKNLLLRYDGPDKHPFVTEDGRTIALRLCKTSRVNDASSSSHASTHDEIDAVDWQERVLKPDLQDVGDQTLLPPLLRVQGIRADLHPFLRQIAAKIEPLRPLERRRISGIDEERTKAVFVTEDLSASLPGSSSLVFEIKPKCGFLPRSAHLSAKTKNEKSQHSRFRMHSIHKNKETTLEEFEQLYDPLDLYDESEERIEKATQALFASWQKGAGNNLRIFIDGCKVDTDAQQSSNKKARQVACHIVKTGEDEDDLRSALSYVLRSPMARSALRKLKSLQERYDRLDVEGVDAICRQEYGKSITELDEREISLQEYEEVVQKGGGSDSKKFTAREVIAAFLLSTMYKDCSLFIRITVQSAQAQTCIHLVDLDPKPISKLAYLYKIDQDIVATFHDWAERNALH